MKSADQAIRTLGAGDLAMPGVVSDEAGLGEHHRHEDRDQHQPPRLHGHSELIDEATNQASSARGGPPRTGAALTEAGLFLGSVIVATVAGAQWRLWPNGHPVVHLASGRDLDVAAMASDRVSKGTPRLADVYADAAGPSR